tara:strand:- start:888 stop:1037 length:150 start_codon:yes stop_codon:yes gene_type:complete
MAIKRRTKNWLKMGLLVLVGAIFSVKIKDSITKVSPQAGAIMDKASGIA